jgi:hypothetical protein
MYAFSIMSKTEQKLSTLYTRDKLATSQTLPFLVEGPEHMAKPCTKVDFIPSPSKVHFESGLRVVKAILYQANKTVQFEGVVKAK